VKDFSSLSRHPRPLSVCAILLASGAEREHERGFAAEKRSLLLLSHIQGRVSALCYKHPEREMAFA